MCVLLSRAPLKIYVTITIAHMYVTKHLVPQLLQLHAGICIIRCSDGFSHLLFLPQYSDDNFAYS